VYEFHRNKIIVNSLASSAVFVPIDSKPIFGSRLKMTLLAVGLVGVIGWFDYVTGDFSLALFYLAPVAIATWFANRATGWFIAVLCATVWLVGDLAQAAAGAQPLTRYWNAAMLVLINGVVVQLLAAFHRLQNELETRVVQRTASLLQANTELDAARLHFIETDKLESIGRLAAGVAHEVKNPLMTINLVADYLAEIIPPSEPDAAAMVEDLRNAVVRANRVISEMLEFSRPNALSLQPDDFHVVAERALGFVKHEFTRKRLHVQWEWFGPAPQLPLDRNKMEQALINILVNAIHATPENGTITLRSREDESGFTAEIDDTGSGISAADQTKLFEPFFTTKPIGQGTGLGLSVARQIIQLHGGTLRLTNRPQGGARATIQIPK
jgi:signal transduction histidine kinase